MFDFLTGEQKIIPGIIIAKVIDNDDKQKLGRILVNFPALSGEMVEYWAPYVVPMAGAGTGTLFLPEKQEQVIVAFENGDIARPYVIGSFWSNVSKPPEVDMGGNNNIRLIKSRSGHMIRLDDTKGKEKIELIDKLGKNLITFDSAKNTITITSDKDILLEAPKGAVKINAKEINLSADKIEVVSKDSLKLDGGSQTVMKGSQVDIN